MCQMHTSYKNTNGSYKNMCQMHTTHMVATCKEHVSNAHYAHGSYKNMCQMHTMHMVAIRTCVKFTLRTW